jgi:hypothetical protein
MEPLAYLFIFGLLAVVVGLIVGGIWLHSGIGAIMIVVGVVGAVAWLIMAYQIAVAMNSDI